MFILVTGATGGIGAATCQHLAGQGFHLFITGQSEQKLTALKASLLDNYNVQIVSIVCNIEDQKALENLFANVNQTLREQQKALAGMVHCAGVLSESLLAMTKAEQIHQSLNVNLYAAILVAQKAARLMMRHKQGVITFVSSVVAEQGSAGQAVYGAAKAGINGFVKSYAKEVGAMGIRVNAVSPGFIETPLVAHYSEQQREKLIAKTSLARLGTAEDVAKLIGFLHSTQADFIHGQIIGVDGGLVL